VAGRIDQAAKAASQKRADALGGGAAVRTDGAFQDPIFVLTQLDPDGRAQPQPSPMTSVGEAIQALDSNVVAASGKVDKAGADMATLRDQLDGGEIGLVRQDGARRDIVAAGQTDGQRIRFDGAAGARTLAGVKAGEVSENSSEVVVGSQLFTVNRDLLKNSVAVGDLETLTGRQGAGLDTLSDRVDSGNVGLTRQDGATNGVSLAADRGGDTVSVAGANGSRQVTGLTDGRIAAGSTDAVSGSQMRALADRVEQLDAQGTGMAIDNEGDGNDRAEVAPGSRSVAIGSNAQATGMESVATGAGARAQGEASAALGAGSQAQATGSVAIGANATAQASGSVAIGEGSQVTRADTVSVGAEGAARQITNVAPATYHTDAVNLGQAINMTRQSANQAAREARRHTDSRVGQLRRENDAGIASAMAMATLPSTSTPGKSMFAVSGATYAGQSAAAMGVSSRSRSGAWVYRISLSGSTGGHTGASVGLTYAW
jgi:hypothetical protein